MKRGRRALIASALLLIAVPEGAAIVFREPIRERWLIWKVEHGDSEQAGQAARELGQRGSLRAIAPLAARIVTPPKRTWFSSRPGPLSADQIAILSALHRIVWRHREESLSYLLVREDMSQVCKDAVNQLARIARRERETLELSLPNGLGVVIR